MESGESMAEEKGKEGGIEECKGRGMKRWRSISTVTKHVKVCITAAFFPVTGSIQILHIGTYLQ